MRAIGRVVIGGLCVGVGCQSPMHDENVQHTVRPRTTGKTERPEKSASSGGQEQQAQMA